VVVAEKNDPLACNPPRKGRRGSSCRGAASSPGASLTYRQAVAVPMPNPAATCANVSPFVRCTSTSSACRPASSFCHTDPIAFRCGRTILAVKFSVFFDNGSGHGNLLASPCHAVQHATAF
jgi:hypothetical protein